MFKNHSMQLKMVKDVDAQKTSPTISVDHQSIVLVTAASEQFVYKACTFIGVTVASLKAIDILGQILVKRTPGR